jgi:hypothetical protein
LNKVQFERIALFHGTRVVQGSANDGKVRIGCGSGFWGDTPTAVAQLVNQGKLDFLVLDYLSEVTMSLLVAAQSKNPDLGWCPDFVQSVGPLLAQIKKQGLKVVTNAGGVNPTACMKMMLSVAEKSGTSIKIALVTGDDLLHAKDKITQDQCPNPSTITSANAYLGAGPITRALDLGADIVITGRCTDSALALGPLVHKFKWSWDNYNLMASGSLAGHLIECGAQSTGGIFTDWEKVPGWANNGFPIAVCEPNGNFLLTKPEGTGGLINHGTVAEQLLYEIGDPERYILPDAVCNFSRVELTEQKNGVFVTGAKGAKPTPYYKVGGTFQDGWKCTSVCPVIGPKAREKARKTADALLTRSRAIFKHLKLPDFTRVYTQVLGTEEAYGESARKENLESRDAVMWLAVQHVEKKALEIFAREIASAGTGMAPGLTAVIGGRPKAVPLLRFFSYLYPKDQMPVTIKTSDGHEESYQVEKIPDDNVGSCDSSKSKASDTHPPTGSNSYKLSDLAWTRSGDKGDHCNIGVIARDPSFYPFLLTQLTSDKVTKYFAHKFTSDNPTVHRYEVPGVLGLNFVLENSLGGGGIAALNPDPQGKGYGQMLADFKIENVPKLI